MEKTEQGHGHGHGHHGAGTGANQWEIPDPAYKCKWHEKGNTEVKDPHVHVERNQPKKIYENVLEAIGNTPLIKINKIHKAQGVQAEFLAKCEFLNPGGSLKDRVGWRMILDAQIRGQIKPGDTLVEPTSGNTGIGMAITSSVLGYKTVFSLPEKMSNEKVDVLRALGADIIRRPTELDHDHPDSYVGAAITRAKQPNHHLLDQYSNASNAMAHYDATSLELLEQCDNKIDYIFISAGTGGCLTGIGRRMKEKLPSCKIVAVDPVGSLQALPGSLNGPPGSYRSEGAGHDYIPMAMDRKVADFWVKTDDPDSFEYARALIREEGLLVGGTAGAVLSGAIKFAKEHNLPATARCILVLPDSIRNYLTKFVSDSWMVDYHFLPTSTLTEKEHKFNGFKYEKLNLRSLPIADENMLVSDALTGIAEGKFPVIPIKKNGDIYKVVRPTDLTSALIAGTVKPTDTIYWTGKRDFTIHDIETIDVAQLEKALRRNPFVLLREHNDKKELTKIYYADEHDIAKLLKATLGI